MSRSGDHLSWPAERYYWKLVQQEDLGAVRPRDRHRTLGYLLEHVAPEPLDAMHWAAVRTASGAWLVCAAPTEALRAVSDQVLTLTPESAPDHFGIDASAAEGLNLLTGEFEPTVVRKQRSRVAYLAAGILLALGVTAAIGLERRTAAARQATAEARRAVASIYDTVLGPTSVPNSNRHHLLVGELRKLERTRTGAREQVPIAEAPAVLTSVLSAWPVESNMRVESLAIGPDGVRVTAVFPNNEAAGGFEQHWRQHPGWAMRSPRLTSQREGVRLTAALHAESVDLVSATGDSR